MSTKTVLITGGAGFIGSHLADRCIADGYQVAIIDDLSGGNTDNLNPQAEFYACDLRDAAQADTLISKIQPELVYHLAANAAEIVAFSLALKPTRVQLESWQSEGNEQLSSLYARYLKMAERLAQSGETFFKELVADTYKPVEQIKEVERTFPAHANGWYLFEDFTTTDEAITLKSFKVFPSMSSTVAATERMLGGVQKRPLT